MKVFTSHKRKTFLAKAYRKIFAYSSPSKEFYSSVQSTPSASTWLFSEKRETLQTESLSAPLSTLFVHSPQICFSFGFWSSEMFARGFCCCYLHLYERRIDVPCRSKYKFALMDLPLNPLIASVLKLQSPALK